MLLGTAGRTYDAGFVDLARAVRVRGRVCSVRRFSKKLTFFDLAHAEVVTTGGGNDDSAEAVPSCSGSSRQPHLQVVVNRKIYREEKSMNLCDRVREGDWLLCVGHPGRTRTGLASDVSLFATSIGVDLYDLSDSSRIVVLLGDAANGRANAKQVARQMGITPTLFSSLSTLLHKPMQRREASIYMSQDAGAKRKAVANSDTLSSSSSSRSISSNICTKPANSLTERQTRLEEVARKKQRNFFVVLEAPSKLSNIAAIMRTCDALGVTKLLLVTPQAGLLLGDDNRGSTSASSYGTSADETIFSGEILRRCSASANFWVETQVFTSVAECGTFLDATHALSYGTVLCEKSQQLWDTKFQPASVEGNITTVNGIALWFGTEVSGLSEAAMRYCQKHIYVPMYGMVESLNLSVCVGIVAGEVVRQRLAFVRTGDGNSLRTTSLSADDQAAWVARMSTRVAKRQRTGRLRVDAGE